MATIGSLGVGSGLDLNGLLDKIAAAEKAPLNAIKARQGSYNAKLSAYGTLQSLIDTLKSAATKLGDAGFMGGFKSTSSATGVLTSSADSTAAAGSYTVNVTALAKAQSLVSQRVADTAADIGADAATLTIDFGVAGAPFVPNTAKTAVSVSLEAGKTSLSDIRDAINKAAGGAVSASIVNDGAGSRLVLAATGTGQGGSMRVTVAAAGAGSLNTDLQALVVYDPDGAKALEEKVAAQDAALTVNGIAVTSATNTVAEAIQGVAMTLVGTGTSTVQVERDAGAVSTAVKDFVDAYNKLNAKVKDLSAYNADKKSGGTLLGDATARMVQSRMRATLFVPQMGQAGDPTLLSEIGISFEKDGTLAIKTSTLDAALSANPMGVARLFTGGTSPLSTGIAPGFASVIDSLAADKEGESLDGLLTLAMSGARKSIALLDKDAARVQDRIDAKIEIYRTQFRQLDMVMSSMSATSNYLTQQFANKST